jgi:hypothetical protein
MELLRCQRETVKMQIPSLSTKTVPVFISEITDEIIHVKGSARRPTHSSNINRQQLLNTQPTVNPQLPKQQHQEKNFWSKYWPWQRTSVEFLFVWFWFFGSTGVWTQGLTLVSRWSYCLSHSSSPVSWVFKVFSIKKASFFVPLSK